ncbi:MAG: hypothetical protein R3C11_17585 [Planctomycetaceae bacterium]
MQTYAPRAAARHAARREGQLQLQNRVRRLHQRLTQLSEQATQLSTSTNQGPSPLTEKLTVPDSFLSQAEGAMERSNRRLKSHDYLLALGDDRQVR